MIAALERPFIGSGMSIGQAAFTVACAPALGILLAIVMAVLS